MFRENNEEVEEKTEIVFMPTYKRSGSTRVKKSQWEVFGNYLWENKGSIFTTVLQFIWGIVLMSLFPVLIPFILIWWIIVVVVAVRHFLGFDD